MKKALILGASSLLLLLTIMFLIPNKSYEHSALQHTTFKKTGVMINTHSGHQNNSWGSAINRRSNNTNRLNKSGLRSSHTSNLSSGSGWGTKSSYRSHASTSSQSYALLSTQHQSNRGHSHYTNYSPSNLQGLSKSGTSTMGTRNKVYANRAVGVTTNYQMANTSLIAQAGSSSYSSKANQEPFADAPVVMNAMMGGFPDSPGEIAPLGHTIALLIFGLSFMLVKVVMKK